MSNAPFQSSAGGGAPCVTRTTTALLDGLNDSGDQESWQEFDRRYRPIILAVARRLGLSESDAADAAQETLVHFIRDYRAGSFDRSPGRLGHWICGIARHRIADMQRAAGARAARRGESALAGLPADREMDRLWDEACRREMLVRAIDELRRTQRAGEKSLAVLDLLFVRQLTPAQVAAELDVPVQSVYVMKSRLAERLRVLLRSQESLFEEPKL